MRPASTLRAALPPAGDDGLSFFLDFTTSSGGAWEQTGDTVMVLLPEALGRHLDLPEELSVTTDPEVAREDGALLVAPGHPVLDAAAASVLSEGDVGRCHLPWPASAVLGDAELVELARASVVVDHGRIDASGLPPSETYLPALRVGVLVTYATSLEDRFQEREEVWVDGSTGFPLQEPVLAHIAGRMPEPGADPIRPTCGYDLSAAIARAHTLIEGRAVHRRRELARHSRGARDDELRRAAAYYDAALASISTRASTATPERRQLLAAQADATSLERQRRLAEIGERFEPHHELRPFRLHLVGVPTLSVPVHVRRGARAFPLTLRWVLGARVFAPTACAHCGSFDILVAGRERLGCRTCLSRASADPHLHSTPTKRTPSPDDHTAPPDPHVARGAQAPARATQETRREPAPAPNRRPGPRPAPKAHAPSSVRPTDRAPGARCASPGSGRLGEERFSRMGDKVAASFWDTVSLGERWRRKQVVPGSPMAALAKLYGSEGPLRAIGIPRSAVPLAVSTVGSQAQPGFPNLTVGGIKTDVGTFAWVLRWQMREGRPVVGEVLPCEVTRSRLPAPEVLPPRVAAQLLDPPAPRIELDAVASRIWDEAIGVLGLTFVLRCLACWWEIESAPGTGGHGAAAMAAAVVDHLRQRCGRSQGTEQASLFGPDPAAVTRAADHIAAVVGPRLARPW